MSEADKDPDELLWKSAQEGDPLALEELAKKIRDLALKSMSPHHQEREDIAQEVVASVLCQLRNLNPPGNLAGFVRFRVLAVIGRLKRDWLVYALDGEFVRDEAACHLTDLFTEEAASVIRKCVQEMPDALRTCLYLRYWKQVRVADIAKKEGVSEMTVYTRIRTALRILRVKLRRLDYGDE